MAGTGSGYDLSVSTFSPDGRVFQVEYAGKAVDNSGLCMAVVCQDGILFAVEKPKPSPLLLPTCLRRIAAVTETIGIAVAGLAADGRQIVTRARQEAEEYKKTFGVEISGGVLAERIGLFMHAYSLYWSVRPFGASVLIGAVQQERGEPGAPLQFKGELYCVDTSGCCSKYRATALGKGRPSAKTELEKLDLETLTTKEALEALTKIFLVVDDEGSKEGKVEVEVGLIGNDSCGVFKMLPSEEVRAAVKRAREALDEMDED
ncbi:putative proteasome subunit alpha type 3 [Neospora caninum Liverpool]|uniref:Proteasome subunit alpha type n=1 Tax=Neospora caninum (strain Liverpool) TaxID=572307 RepID=F0VPA8_NEOCL|nr:putative proteasome subunit alpha type 3 [Neospora caninum Liverpool]CBZ55554.1 putative proteasome subunit alpha type 3 [Neospora caninum Liverpool]CEL70294.1 TPA: proteasome subunit alpha type 3, putative [Neospora caninum Liverpool]|eukprot:XP_003885582.1 putative proteasome subunit alpha type 3 [Neospora caninum Liverpool]